MRILLIVLLLGWAGAADAAMKWCRYEKDTVCRAADCTVQDAPPSIRDFKLTIAEPTNSGTRTSCLLQDCTHESQRFAVNPANRNILTGEKGWTLAFPAEDNRFVEFVAFYFEEKGAKIPAAQIRTGYCANEPIQPPR